MTDRPTPITDEELSAHLDGEAAPAVAARIEADPEAQVRLAALAASSRVVADTPVPPLDATVVDDLVARALQALDEEPSAPEQPAAADQATPIVPRRARRLPPAWLVAAAVVLVVVLGIGLVVTGSNKDDGGQQTASGGATTGADDRDRTEAAEPPALDRDDGATGSASEHGADASPGTVPNKAFDRVAPVDLGAFATPELLRAALAPGFPSPPATSSTVERPTTKELARCGTQVAVTLDLLGDPLHLGYGTVEDRPVLVYEFAATSYTDRQPTTLVAAVGARSCDQVITFQR